LRVRHGKFDLLQLNYNAAGPFPSCFNNMSIAEKKEAHQKVLHRNLQHFIEITRVMEPRYVMPFAGDYVIGGDQWKKNEYLGTTTLQLAACYLRDHQCPAPVVVLNEGLTFDLVENRIVNGDYVPIDPAAQKKYIRDELSTKIYPHQLDGALAIHQADEFFSKHLVLARANLLRMQARLGSFQSLHIYLPIEDKYFHFNYELEESEFVEKKPDFIEPYMECTLDLRLLKRILLRQAHWNNAEIGCLIDFVRRPDIYRPDVHTLLSFFHVPSP